MDISVAGLRERIKNDLGRSQDLDHRMKWRMCLLSIVVLLIFVVRQTRSSHDDDDPLFQKFR